jgi:hypothetical protein
VEYVYTAVDRVHDTDSWVNEPSLNTGHSFADMRLRSNEVKHFLLLLIGAADQAMDGAGWVWLRVWRCKLAGTVVPWLISSELAKSR